jgi:hypothetical protein
VTAPPCAALLPGDERVTAARLLLAEQHQPALWTGAAGRQLAAGEALERGGRARRPVLAAAQRSALKATLVADLYRPLATIRSRSPTGESMISEYKGLNRSL